MSPQVAADIFAAVEEFGHSSRDEQEACAEAFAAVVSAARNLQAALMGAKIASLLRPHGLPDEIPEGVMQAIFPCGVMDALHAHGLVQGGSIPIPTLLSWVYNGAGSSQDRPAAQLGVPAPPAPAAEPELPALPAPPVPMSLLGPAAPRATLVTREDSERLALSVHYIAGELLGRVESAGLSRDSTIHDIEDRVIRAGGSATVCPRDGRLGAAFVDAVHGEDSVGCATHMLSYTWRYTVSDIAEALSRWCARAGRDPRRTYVWMCCMCVNQHRVREAHEAGRTVPFCDFKRVFEGRVQSIGRVVALMMPWHAPAYIGRSWCMLEMYTAIQLGHNCELTIVMPPGEEDAFTAALIHANGLDRIYKALQRASIEHAQASVAEDEVNILRLVREGQGTRAFDDKLKKHLQGWFLRVANEHVQGLPMKLLTACSKVGKMTSDLGDLDRAGAILRFGWSNMQMALFRDEDWRDKVEVTGDLWHELGWIHHKRGERSSAIEAYEEGLRQVAAIDGQRCMAASRLHRGRGRALIGDEPDEAFLEAGAPAPADEDVLTAIADYTASLDILGEHGKRETEDGAKLFNNLGLARTLRSDFGAALADFDRAGRIREGLGSTQDPGNARRLYNTASMHLKRGRVCGEPAEAEGHFREAVLLFREAVRILEAASLEPDLVERCDAKLRWMEERGVSCAAKGHEGGEVAPRSALG